MMEVSGSLHEGTFAEVGHACRAMRIPIHGYQPVSDVEFRRAGLGLGWHPDHMGILSGLLATVAAGRAAAVTEDVAKG